MSPVEVDVRSDVRYELNGASGRVGDKPWNLLILGVV